MNEYGRSPSRPVTIVVDAFGGDRGPEAVIKGAREAARGRPDLSVVLAGPEGPLREELARLSGDRDALPVLDCKDRIAMEEPPVEALRHKKESAIHRAAGLVREGNADGLVSAGNTGAVMAIYKVVAGSLPGVERPALAARIPTPRGVTVLLDVGANIAVRPSHLVQFAVMGHCYSHLVLGVERPRIGLLSVGEEDVKGTEVVRDACTRLRSLSLNFIGNVEGSDLFCGKADVVVADGFTGNVALKVAEAAVETVAATLLAALPEGSVETRESLAKALLQFDYKEHGGAPLLGVRGACIVCHGRSGPRAIRNGIMVAADYSAKAADRLIESELGLVGREASA